MMLGHLGVRPAAGNGLPAPSSKTLRWSALVTAPVIAARYGCCARVVAKLKATSVTFSSG